MYSPDKNMIPCQIHDNLKFGPFFKDTIGAINGSHIKVSPPAILCPGYHNWKSGVSWNHFFCL